jgi:hypothetical protein
VTRKRKEIEDMLQLHYDQVADLKKKWDASSLGHDGRQVVGDEVKLIQGPVHYRWTRVAQ